jgi:stearoyl-CoA desaturase (delta-9 desaturase)
MSVHADREVERPAKTTSSTSPARAEGAEARGVATERSPADRILAWINFGAVVIPFLGFIAAMALTWGTAFNWTYLVILAVMSILTAGGVTIGFHRLCTHKSFNTSAPMRYLFAALGSMAVQGPVIRWCAEHRRHHQHSDSEGDPHSPYIGPNGSWGEGFWATLRGAYHSHVGWLFEGHSKALGKYSLDLRRDPVLVAADRHFPYLVLLGLAIPAAVGGAISHTWMGVLLGFLWGGLVRILIVHHITWSVNSVCHIWGTRPFDSHDHSRNNVIVGILAMGEGWHNNHHAFPTSARHGLRWWEFDSSYLIIRAMQFVGLVRDVRVPTKERVASKLAADAKGKPRLEHPTVKD